MARAKRIEGVLAPVITPFRKDYAPDAERFVRHCRWLLKNGCSGLAVFGTNSEANSMSVPEKRRLLEALIAGGIAGGRDPSGAWSNPRRWLGPLAKGGLEVSAGSGDSRPATMRHGGKGCIAATGNINPGAIDNLYRNWCSPDAERQQAAITATRKIVQKQPMIAALKATVAHFGNDPQWKTLRPPLIELNSAQERD